jgi:DNA-binding MarR family transcriptional regulator
VIVKEKAIHLTRHQRTLLHLVAQQQEGIIGALAALTGVSSVAATKNIHRLEEKRLVMRVEVERDQRPTLIVLTAPGQRVVDDTR